MEVTPISKHGSKHKRFESVTPSPGYGTTYNNDESMDPFEKFETSLGPNILPSTRLSFGKSYVEEFMNEDETGDVDNLEKPSRVQQLVEQFEEHQRQMSSRSEHYHDAFPWGAGHGTLR